MVRSGPCVAGVVHLQHPLMIVYAYTHVDTNLDHKDYVTL